MAEEKKYNYVESEAVRLAKAALDAQNAQKPGAYQSQWSQQLNDTLDKIQNRQPFKYDMNADALYQQYKDNYVRMGKNAMMDTIGQAASLTGGYGNSYATTAGSQAYHNYLQGLNDVLPQLHQLALNTYNQGTQDLYNKYSLYGEQEAQDYNRYMDSLNAYNTERNFLENKYNTERDADYSRYMDALNYQYQQERDAVADAQWQKEFDFALQKYNDSKNAASSGSGGGGSSQKEDKGGGGGTLTAKDFQNSVMSQVAFDLNGGVSNGKKYTSYKDYISATLKQWYEKGLSTGEYLNSNELAKLKGYYGVK